MHLRTPQPESLSDLAPALQVFMASLYLKLVPQSLPSTYHATHTAHRCAQVAYVEQPDNTEMYISLQRAHSAEYWFAIRERVGALGFLACLDIFGCERHALWSCRAA